jgi:hypothetical protein
MHGTKHGAAVPKVCLVLLCREQVCASLLAQPHTTCLPLLLLLLMMMMMMMMMLMMMLLLLLLLLLMMMMMMMTTCLPLAAF